MQKIRGRTEEIKGSDAIKEAIIKLETEKKKKKTFWTSFYRAYNDLFILRI
jgi:hypothetical protein